MDQTAPFGPNEDERMPWGILASLACSLLIVIVGMLLTYRIWRSTNQEFHELYHVNETVQGLQARLSPTEARVR